MSEFQELNAQYVDLTGRDLFAYATQPTPGGATKYVFQEEVIANRTAALAYMRFKIAEAKAQAVMANTPHDYEPSETYVTRHSAPLCVICGQPKHEGLADG